MTRPRDLAFARVFSNLLLGGTVAGALVAMMRIWIRENEQRERERG